MDRDVILESNKQARIRDEDTELVDNRARKKGEFVLMCLIVLLMVYNPLKGIQGDDLMTVFWTYASVIYLHKYRIYHQKTDLAAAVAAIMAASANLLLYFLRTW